MGCLGSSCPRPPTATAPCLLRASQCHGCGPGQALHTALTKRLPEARQLPGSSPGNTGGDPQAGGWRPRPRTAPAHSPWAALGPSQLSPPLACGLLPDSRPQRFRKWAPGPWPSHCFPERAGVRSTWPSGRLGEFWNPPMGRGELPLPAWLRGPITSPSLPDPVPVQDCLQGHGEGPGMGTRAVLGPERGAQLQGRCGKGGQGRGSCQQGCGLRLPSRVPGSLNSEGTALHKAHQLCTWSFSQGLRTAAQRLR